MTLLGPAIFVERLYFVSSLIFLQIQKLVKMNISPLLARVCVEMAVALKEAVEGRWSL